MSYQAMAEQYFSIHPEESAKVYINYNVGQAQAPPQQHISNFLDVQTLNGDCDYSPSAGAYYSASAVNKSIINTNNNCNADGYCSVGYGSGFGHCDKGGNCNTSSHIYTNNVLPSSFTTKYSNCGGYIYGGMPVITAPTPVLDAILRQQTHQNRVNFTQSYYAQQSNGTSCSYQRNRYMPYNRCSTTSPSLHQPFHTANPITSSILTNTVNYNQYAMPIYKTRPSAQLLTSRLSVPTVSVQPSLVANTMATTSTSQKSVANTELAYSHPKTSPSSASTAVTTTDTKNTSASLSTVTTTSCSSITTVSTSTPFSTSSALNTAHNETVTLQITNLDFSMDEAGLRNFLLNQLKPITPVVSLTFEGTSYAKVTVPDLYFAKQVVSNLHRKKVRHKRMLVSYTRDSSLTEINTLRCQVAGLLKDVPAYTLPMYKFRELFQSRFKTSISVLDLYKMQDICNINSDNNEDKFITLHPDLVNSMEGSPLMEGLQHSVPYCTIHFKKEQHKGWAEQEIEPLPNVFITISEIQKIIHPLLKSHSGDVPVASLVHCIEGHLKTKVIPNENGVNLEHLVCCIQGVQITVNNFGIKILGWLESTKEIVSSSNQLYSKNSTPDPLYQISREVIELIKMSPKATMKFNRFIPAYHNHFGKQCRVADYGYTKLIELFEALSGVVQIMGDGENRQITLTHRSQIRRFTSDLLRVLRAHGNKSVLLSQLPSIIAHTQNRTFDITDYGVCDIVDILDGLVNSNIVVVSAVQDGKDILISIPKRKQTATELEKTCIFAAEIVELFRNAPQYTILFQKFVRSYHYHFGYQCRLSDYGFQKLTDLMEAVHGIVEMEVTNDEDKKIFLNSKVARRVFAEQIEELILKTSGCAKTATKLEDVLVLHKKKYGYQITAQALGVQNIAEAIVLLPYIEFYDKGNNKWITCHHGDPAFRNLCYKAIKYLLIFEIDKYEEKKQTEQQASILNEELNPRLTLSDFIQGFNKKHKECATESTVRAMKHAVEISEDNNIFYVAISAFMRFLMSIVHLLEQRSTMLIQDIKATLDCSISTTFEFGYPNLFSILTAYNDVFKINIGATYERSEVSLVKNSEMRLTPYANHKHMCSFLKLNYSKDKNTRPRPQLSDSNSRNATIQGPPAKTRALSSDSVLYNNSYPSAINSRPTNIPINYYQHSSKSLTSTKNYTNGNPLNSISTSSLFSTPLQQSNVFNTSITNNKENSLNSSMLFNQSFNNSSNTSSSSYCDLNGSTTSTVNPLAGGMPTMQPQSSERNLANSSHVQQMPSVYATSKLWDRRHGCNIPQPFIDPAHNNNLPLMVAPLQTACQTRQSVAVPSQHSFMPINEETSVGLYELVNNNQMCPIYEPPKPDTPPSQKLPFWIDPIWKSTSSSEKTKDNLLNIRLPELKAFNVFPMLLSPYSLSKIENMKQVFNFDSHDRKIS